MPIVRTIFYVVQWSIRNTLRGTVITYLLEVREKALPIPPMFTLVKIIDACLRFPHVKVMARTAIKKLPVNATATTNDLSDNHLRCLVGQLWTRKRFKCPSTGAREVRGVLDLRRVEEAAAVLDIPILDD